MKTSTAASPAAVIVGHEAPVKLVEYSPDGRLLATGDTERNLKVWEDGRPIFERDLHAWHDRFRALDRIRSLAFSPDSRRLFVASSETVKVFDLGSGELVEEHGRPPTWAFLITCPQSLAVNREGTLACAFDDGHIEIKSPDGVVFDWFNNDAPRIVAFLRDGQRIVGTDFATVTIWDTGSGKRLAKFKGDRKTFAVAASPVADIVATRSLHYIRLWNSETGKQIVNTETRPGLPQLLFHPVKSWLAVTDSRGVSLMDFNLREVTRFDAGAFIPLSMAFPQAGGRIAVGGSDGDVRVYEVPGF